MAVATQVINAYNEDKPFDAFTIEQLADVHFPMQHWINSSPRDSIVIR